MNFDIESEYKKYLELVGLQELKMLPVQRMETRRAFIAGYGMCFRQFEFVSSLSDDDAMKHLAEIEESVANFFNYQATIKRGNNESRFNN